MVASLKSTTTALAVVCLFLTLAAMMLCCIGLLAPEWWRVDILEYDQVWMSLFHFPLNTYTSILDKDWKFGLWLYCWRGGRMNNELPQFANMSHPWICDTRRTLAGYHVSGRIDSAMFDGNQKEYTGNSICISIITKYSISQYSFVCAWHCYVHVSHCVYIIVRMLIEASCQYCG